MENTNTDLGIVATVGLDLAKHVFQVHAVVAAGRVVISRAYAFCAGAIGREPGCAHHKVRELLVAQRTQLLNALRGHLAAIGIITAQGLNNARALAVLIMQGNDMIPATCARRCYLSCGG